MYKLLLIFMWMVILVAEAGTADGASGSQSETVHFAD